MVRKLIQRAEVNAYISLFNVEATTRVGKISTSDRNGAGLVRADTYFAEPIQSSRYLSNPSVCITERTERLKLTEAIVDTTQESPSNSS